MRYHPKRRIEYLTPAYRFAAGFAGLRELIRHRLIVEKLEFRTTYLAEITDLGDLRFIVAERAMQLERFRLITRHTRFPLAPPSKAARNNSCNVLYYRMTLRQSEDDRYTMTAEMKRIMLRFRGIIHR